MLTAVILRLLHYVLSLGVFVKDLILNIPNAYGVMWKKRNSESIRHDTKSLKKLPMHVGLVMAENDFCYKDIANIIVWSVAMGISYISVYDVNGELKRSHDILDQHIQRSKQETFQSEESQFLIELRSFTSKRNTAVSSEGFRSRGRHASVHLVDADDGRKSLVETTQTLCRLVDSEECRVEDIVPSIVDTHLQKKFGLPDPDLVILLGQTDSLLGYLPWQVRLTEILTLSTHKGIDYKSFFSIINTYGKTEQRLGK